MAAQAIYKRHCLGPALDADVMILTYLELECVSRAWPSCDRTRLDTN
jgi:hypothetical protein